MKIHHLNCGSVREIEPTYAGPAAAHAVNHCLLIETDRDGLVLVETGIGLDDVRRPDQTLGADWVSMSQPVLDERETAVRQVEQLGFNATDVRHIVLTHLDVDHCGGLPDFRHADVHVLAAELEAATDQAPSYRYRPAHWAHAPRWVTYENLGDDDWFGFRSLPLRDLGEDLRLVPLGGHTAGHTGVAVRDGARWLLHGGDAYFYHRELTNDPEPHPLLDFVQTSSEVDHDLRVGTQARLRALIRQYGAEVDVISAHDPWEFARYATLDLPRE
jgi:glyoxylase-like metal-dependent hydrolase (beta-lactamase superfamily II)